jgi:hypothetical protein
MNKRSPKAGRSPSHIHKKADSSASNPVRSHLQSRPFIVQAQPQSQKPLTQTETEDQEFQQQKFEATKLKLQAKSGTITPEGQERLTVLQAKMSGSLQRKLEQASRFGHNFANIPLSRPHAPSQPVVQTKLKIGEPGDKFEKDADQFAQELDKLTHAPVPGQIEQNPQPKEMSVAEKEIQTKPMLQLRAAVGGMTATAGLETAINQARSGGQPLADNVRKPMEQFSGTDLSRVKVHTDQKADQLSRAIQARAFTTGQDIFFAKGEYKPSSREGQKLIFHEGRHVAQQNGAAVQRSPNSDKKVTSIGNILQRNPNDKKREREESPEIGNDLMNWLGNDRGDTSYMEDDKMVHKIIKNEKDLACWNWALTGLSDEGGPSPEKFWNYILQSNQEELPWMNNIISEVKEQIISLTNKISKAKLSIDPFKSNARYNKTQKDKAKELLTEACSLIVQAHGMSIASGGEEAAGWVVCQYKPKEGAAVPEHWWIELPGGVVIQTVPGQDLEIGDESTKFHTQGGRFSGDAKEYGEIRIPVKSLKGSHINILKKGMDDAKNKRQKIDKGSV